METQTKRIGFWMDPIENIKPYKDTSFALMLAAQELGHEIVYLPKNGLSLHHGEAKAIMQAIQVTDGVNDNFATLGDPAQEPLTSLDAILIRVDPPFDSEYLYGTHILERAKKQGVNVVNNPQAIRDCNEKLFATEFSALMPSHQNTTIFAHSKRLRAMSFSNPSTEWVVLESLESQPTD